MIVVLLLILLWCVYTLYLKQRHDAIGHKLPPCLPGALPFIGHSHLLLLWSKDVFGCIDYLAQFCLKMGGVTYGYFAGEIYYGVADPEDAVTVCNTVTQKHFLYKFGNSFLGQGLLLSSGPQYKHHRKLLIPAFSTPMINGFMRVFNDQSKRLVELLDDKVGKGEFQPSSLLRNLALRTSCLTVFGDSDDKDTDFINTFIKTLDGLLTIMMERLKRVWLHNDYIFNLTNLKKQEDELVKLLSDTCYEVVQRKRNDLQNRVNLGSLMESEEGHTSFIDAVVQIAQNGELTDSEIKEELTTAVVTSFDTTSQQITFALVFIGSFPDVQEKMYKEIMEVVGEKDVDKCDLAKLVYLDAVIKESLRLLPPVSLLARYVDKDVQLKNYTLRAGTNVLCLVGGIHKNKKYWGPDVEDFRPERWLEKDMQTKLEAIYFAFSVGKRSCLGRKYAMTSIKTSLVHIIRNFRVKADYKRMKYRMDVVTRPESGHEITLDRRSLKYDENNNELFKEAVS